MRRRLHRAQPRPVSRQHCGQHRPHQHAELSVCAGGRLGRRGGSCAQSRGSGSDSADLPVQLSGRRVSAAVDAMSAAAGLPGSAGPRLHHRLHGRHTRPDHHGGHRLTGSAVTEPQTSCPRRTAEPARGQRSAGSAWCPDDLSQDVRSDSGTSSGLSGGPHPARTGSESDEAPEHRHFNSPR